ncbi:MAG: hypothetical protein MUC36_26460 [Planctomycetes bacterium]|jgi:hypothetical protein|nr:hypothetical protein [Planctomycetota bacterium]
MNEAPEPDPNRKSRPTRKPARSNRVPFDLFDRRKRRIEAFEPGQPSPRRDMALAMCEFDRRTDPAQLRHDGDHTAAQRVLDVTQYLIHRVKQRAGYALQQREFEPVPVPPAGDPSGLREQIVAVEKLFRTALLAAFQPKGTKVFPIRKFERAFAAFVGGEIGMPTLQPKAPPDDLALHGQPDGANYFCFAEAALLFLHCRLAPAFWAPLLRTFVGGAQFFAARYWNRSDRSWAAYQTETKQPIIPNAVILATIDHTHAAMNPSRLARHFTDLVGLALRDDPTLSAPCLTAKELS